MKVLKQRGGAFRTEAAFISKDTILKYGLLDSTYKIAGDYNYFLKLYKKGVKFKYLNLPISEFELGGISSDGLECTKECKRALKNNGCNTFQISIIYFMRKIKIYNTFKNLSIKYIKKC